MIIREPIVAGRFYSAERERCVEELGGYLAAAAAAPGGLGRIVGGIVPHAGWMCSGQVAATVFAAIAKNRRPEVLVLFGGVHRYRGQEAAMFGSGRWETPLGPIEIDARLAERVAGHTNLIVDDPYAHEEEHSLEVQVPFLKHLFPKAKILPIMVPPRGTADEVGDAVARTLTAYKYDAVVVGTTDLTHYGPHYGFVPHGIGGGGNRWAKETNDRRFIELTCAMKSGSMVAEALEHKNACSSGAAAATTAACAGLGAKRGVALAQTCSSEVLAKNIGEPMEDSVGYAGIVFAGP
jgi:hypothetical protein